MRLSGVDVYFRSDRIVSWLAGSGSRYPSRFFRRKETILPVKPPRSTPPVKPIVAVGLVIAGTFIALLGLLADVLNIGTGQGFGYYQMIVLISGLVLLLGGAAMLLQRRSNTSGDDDFEPEP